MSDVSATSYVNSSSTGYSDGSTRLPAKSLSQDDFLKLLVTQMASQDPLNPKADLDMAAQMAQFTSLEQTRTMSGSLNSLLGEQQVLQANGMLGRQVELQVDSETTVSGVVQSVDFVAGEPQLMVNGAAYSLYQVLSIAPAPVIME
jgi:flagellar basal-body rod modification protein FlgD